MSQKPLALIVDDEWRLAQNLKRFLQRRGYEAEAVSSVASANRVIAWRHPDLALIDLKLPDSSGRTLCQSLHRRCPDTDLLVMSAYMGENDYAELDRYGVCGYLTKPFPLSDLDLKLLELKHNIDPRPFQQSVQGSNYSDKHQHGGVAARPQPRVVLYSHDTMGLGHMRRNILIARTLAESDFNANVLLVSGAREIGKFDLPTGVDCLVLPSYSKSSEGEYKSKHLDMETQELVDLRSLTINASVNAFDPDILVVDNVPRGALNELDGVLSSLHARGRTRLVLGLRDILDEPEATRREWDSRKNLPAIQWYYDEVWVYGDPAIFNLCEAYEFGPKFNEKVFFTGYLDARKRDAPKASEILSPRHEDDPPGQQPYNLCMVGGGQDGFHLALAFAHASQPPGTRGIIISGPFMLPEQIDVLNKIGAERGTVDVLGFVPEPTRLLQHARCVVAMGGYNTVNEVLSFQRDTLIVPRIRPRLEQLIRARHLADKGYVDMLHPDQLSPENLSAWLLSPEGKIPRSQLPPVNISGLQQLVARIQYLVEHEA